MPIPPDVATCILRIARTTGSSEHLLWHQFGRLRVQLYLPPRTQMSESFFGSWWLVFGEAFNSLSYKMLGVVYLWWIHTPWAALLYNEVEQYLCVSCSHVDYDGRFPVGMALPNLLN